MKRTLITLFITSLAIVLWTAPTYAVVAQTALAQAPQTATPAAGGAIGGVNAGAPQTQSPNRLSGCVDGKQPGQWLNPLGCMSIIGIFSALLDVVMVLAVPVVVFFIVWAGFLYVTARGNPTQLAQANKALTYALIGGVIVLGASIILSIITNTINDVGGGFPG